MRLYEELKLIPKPERQKNGYRIFTDFHIQQIKFARTAFQVEILQNGLRKQMIQAIKLAADSEFDQSQALIQAYIGQLRQERSNAKEAIGIVRELLSGEALEDGLAMRRREVSAYLGISMDTLRNWEMNGLLWVKRKQNGYRVYTADDVRRLKIIRSLRCANYSLEAILRMLRQLSKNPDADIEAALNTPRPSDDIISACDQLLTSLSKAEENAKILLDMLQNMKEKFK